MTNLLKALFPIVVLCFIACNNKVDSYGNYSVYIKHGDSSICILTMDSEQTSYSFHSDNIKLDLKTLVNYKEFLVDKNGAYSKYEISDDCFILPIDEADLPTFHVLDNSIYAKDKNHVYDSRNGILSNADVNSFESVEIDGHHGTVTGKDKNHYFFWDKIIEDTIGFARQIIK